ncbi:MAG: nucleotidyltransferase domain-containing protein [Spirochaetales bacterium]|nr:hypothetical protein [Leptospiraceae bacterium]MCP5483503.1 nucleotidyltransferase domain-containing protein [Spirochaetales bacterium]MCP5486745.1 nucleotidyltransferase domain-containing protein [Spirochaetales bacterium]
MSPDEIVRRLQPVFENRPEIVFVFLFGSAVGAMAPRDIDIAVYANVEPTERLDWRADLHGELCDALGTNEVDLVHLNATANIMLLDEIVRKGRVIFERDRSERVYFVVGVWHRAIDFKEKRKLLMGL